MVLHYPFSINPEHLKKWWIHDQELDDFVDFAEEKSLIDEIASIEIATASLVFFLFLFTCIILYFSGQDYTRDTILK